MYDGGGYVTCPGFTLHRGKTLLWSIPPWQWFSNFPLPRQRGADGLGGRCSCYYNVSISKLQIHPRLTIVPNMTYHNNFICTLADFHFRRWSKRRRYCKIQGCQEGDRCASLWMLFGPSPGVSCEDQSLVLFHRKACPAVSLAAQIDYVSRETRTIPGIYFFGSDKLGVFHRKSDDLQPFYSCPSYFFFSRKSGNLQAFLWQMKRPFLSVNFFPDLSISCSVYKLSNI